MLCITLLALAAACTGRPAPTTKPRKPSGDSRSVERGVASWYGKKFHGRRTASGERYDMFRLTAAHRTLPFGARVRVVNLRNGRVVTVRINDRGPFVKGRIIDLSYAAARELGMVRSGLAQVEIRRLR